MHPHLGEIAALVTAFFWTITALAFEAAGKKIGSLSVNLLRLLVGFAFLTTFTWIYRGTMFPTDATPEMWFYLVLSGFVGFVFGDYCLFQAFVLIGARVSMLIMALAPPITALIGWIILGEKLAPMSWLGMTLTISGIALVVLKKQDKIDKNGDVKRVRLSYSLWGLLLALGGAIGQGAGLVLSKFAMNGFDPFASAQIRVMAGIFGFAVIISVLGRWKDIFSAVKQRVPMLELSTGAFFGPFLGVSFSLMAVANTSSGIAATIMAIVPVLIIPPSVWINKEKVTLREILGACLAVSGVGLFFL